MWIVSVILSIALVFLTLIDAFETIIQPRRVTRPLRLARLYYRSAWAVWRFLALCFTSNRRRESFLGVFGPMSMLGLLMTWMILLIVAFAVLYWAMETPVRAPEDRVDFGSYLYLSGTTMFTLGFGDITPMSRLGRALSVLQSGLGFGFFAVIISYLPVLYQAYAQRETTIGLLDARAGSPPTAGEFLLRAARSGNIDAIDPILAEWERWCAKLLEIQLSFPVLSSYRSQHHNQSWLAALTMILDTCALLLAEVKRKNVYQAQLTFAMARHAAVDLSVITPLKVPSRHDDSSRFTAEQRDGLRGALRSAGVTLNDDQSDARLSELRGMYEPFLFALAERFLFNLPPVVANGEVADNWQRSAWMARTPGLCSLRAASVDDADSDHFG